MNFITDIFAKVVAVAFLLGFIVLGVLFLTPALFIIGLMSHKRNDYWTQVNMGYKVLTESMFGTDNLIVRMLVPPVMILGLIIGAFAAVVLESRYWFRVWRDFDCFFNAVFDGHHLETISSRLGKSIYHGHEPVFFRHVRYDKIVSWCLNQVDPNHCWNSINKYVGEPVELSVG